MKVMVELPEKNYKELRNNFLSAECKSILKKAINKGVVIPDNATNGDVIKALFPDCERESRLNEECIEVMGAYRVVDRSWWDAAYKGRQ